MKLIAFRIRNYRSIVDTNWVSLSPDNITTLIGQNESGKTSVLEALYSFHTGIIHEDILRSDLSLPYISCCFATDKPYLRSLLDSSVIKPEVYENIILTGKIFINRRWTDQNNSILFYGDDQLLKTYEEEIQKENQYITELEETVQIIFGETQKTKTDFHNLLNEHTELKKVLTALQKKENRLLKLIERTRNENKNEQYNKDHSVVNMQNEEYKEKYASLDTDLKTRRKRLEELICASKYAELFLASGRNYKESDNHLEELKRKLQSRMLELRFCTNDKKSVTLRNNVRDLNAQISEITSELKKNKLSFQFHTECLSLALSDKIPENIPETAAQIQHEKQRLISLEELGQLLFKYLPSFKLFEDFSSLLPNRIDLDDILNLNTAVEGYNAVKNFLIVSGLDASFFTEQNNRILKQKIENLNGEITLNFQDYWRQNLGRNNKIKINFELEHYDFSHPVKKGKPYLEFWIKDEHERLYPKQRSRGVRWFLSFYLELKATSLKKSSAHNVLLIDEPGLSLHARAQEDVLKVFEDMKENIQILYSTHSPHLVNISKLYRILAIQRADEYNDKSESLIFDTKSLGNASGDTLSPIYSLIGTRLS